MGDPTSSNSSRSSLPTEREGLHKIITLFDMHKSKPTFFEPKDVEMNQMKSAPVSPEKLLAKKH